MGTKLFDDAIVGSDGAVDFVTSLLQACVTHSIIGKSLDGTILLWNEGARRLYGYEPEEVIGKLNSAILYTPEEAEAGKPDLLREAALRYGKWEGVVTRVRKNGERFPAQVVLSPRKDAAGTVVGFLVISKDISEETALIERLRDAQAYNRSLIDSNVDPLVVTDPVGIVTDVSQQLEKLTGRTREEMIGTPFRNFFADVTKAEDVLSMALRMSRTSNRELPLVAKNGSTTMVSCNASTFYDPEGKLQGILASARDITEQKRLENHLRGRESYNRALIEASVDGLIAVDPSGTISDVNEQMCRMTGYSREALLGTPFTDYFADFHRAMEAVRFTFRNHTATDCVLTLLTQQGKPLKISLNASVFCGPSGEIAGLLASARDITEQAHLQEQLASEHAYSRGVIEASLDGLIAVDELTTVTDVNEAMCRMSGYSREELIGSEFPAYFTNPGRAAAGVRLVLEKGSIADYELTLRTRTGEERTVSFNAAVFRDRVGIVRGIFAAARDITEQKRQQAESAQERAYDRSLIEASMDGIVTVDESMAITDINDAMAKMLGRPQSQLLGSGFCQYFAEPESAAAVIRATLSEGAASNAVLVLMAPDTQSLAVSINARVLKDGAGNIRGVFASARDITGQKEVEDKLHVSQFYTRSLIESSLDALAATSPLGLISDVNREMERLTGRRRDELIGTPFKSHFADPARAEGVIRGALRLGKVTNHELAMLTADGSTRMLSYHAATFCDQEGGLQGVIAAGRDVTEQKNREEKLSDQLSYLRGLIESSVDGLLTVDAEGFICDVNERMCKMMGYGRHELVGSRFRDYFTDAGRAQTGVDRAFEEGYITEYRLTLVARGRRVLQISFDASVFRDSTGNVRGIFASARDITDRLHLENQLREQQGYLRGLIESSVDGLIAVDPQGFITDVNEQMCRMSGYQREELIGSPFRHYFSDPNQAHAGIKRTIAEGSLTNYQLVLKSKTGRKATVSFDASVFRDSEGDLQGVFASARDISEQARLQTQLIEQQAYNRSLIEASPDALFAVSPEGTILDVNRAAVQATGYSRHHLVNSSFASYFLEPELAVEAVTQALADRRLTGRELTLVTRHGRRIGMSFNAGVFTDVADNPLGTLVAARDITAQKELEAQLRDSQFYTRSLIESNIDALMVTGPLGIITDVNQQMERLTGYSREELIGSPFREYFADPERAEAAIRLVLREGHLTNYDLTARAKDGSETVVSYNATTFRDQQNMLKGILAAARDVTDRKQYEQMLQEKNRELEQANLAKDRFLASMSHELRTPLTAIIGFTGTMLMKLPGPLTANQEKQLQTVRSSARHLLSLINDLLDLARIESGKVEITLESVRCQSVLEEVTATLRPLAEQKGLRFQLNSPGREVLLRTDRRSLHQIVLNLCNNAIKFTQSGEVRVDFGERRINGHSMAEIQVTDTGVGIRAEDQARLFQAFQQVGPNRYNEGTGLGLYLSQRLARLLGGNIEFRSEAGQGSQFTLLLPEEPTEIPCHSAS